jgi:hypothetical protein
MVDVGPTINASTSRQTSLSVTGKVIKASAGTFFGVEWAVVGVPAYIKMYDQATAPDENDTPKMTIFAEEATNGGHALWDAGIKFSNGISWRATRDVPDNDTDAPTLAVNATAFFV